MMMARLQRFSRSERMTRNELRFLVGFLIAFLIAGFWLAGRI